MEKLNKKVNFKWHVKTMIKKLKIVTNSGEKRWDDKYMYLLGFAVIRPIFIKHKSKKSPQFLNLEAMQ